MKLKGMGFSPLYFMIFRAFLKISKCCMQWSMADASIQKKSRMIRTADQLLPNYVLFTLSSVKLTGSFSDFV